MIVVRRSASRTRKPTKHARFPSPEKIRKMTEEIRKSWTPRDFCRRSNTLGHLEIVELALSPRKGFWGD